MGGGRASAELQLGKGVTADVGVSVQAQGVRVEEERWRAGWSHRATVVVGRMWPSADAAGRRWEEE